ncbi:toll-like receptor 21 [Anguilla anguilla]|uniref:toll-like receptor 21 n=1 Tax=Anguilla anguilla TaxID=7936 RepID=UPI0015AAB42A|nr:toll-like receptor 21 [Anguilla anguilla]
MERSTSIALAIAIIFIQLVLFAAAYSFQNCIENPANRSSFNCINRSQTNISALVQDLPGRATSLNISHNHVSHIPPRSMSHLWHLKNLRIDCNHLKKVSTHAFLNLTQLKMLNLSSNNIETIEPLAFIDLQNLTELVLSKNSLQNVQPQVFWELKKLQILNFRINSLSNFSEIVESVAHLQSLKELDLCNNHLNSLHHSLSLPPSLSTLYICKNHLYTLECNSTFLNRIRLLDLSNNLKLQTNSFIGLDLRAISYLRLHSTSVSALALLKLRNVKPGYVDYSGLALNNSTKLMGLCSLLKNRLKKLHKLTLQGNNILTLSDGTFKNCPVVTLTLDLSHNHLKNTTCLRFMRGQNHLESIILEHNLLCHIETCHDKQNMSFPNLTSLSFRYNRIRDVYPFAFSQTPRLTTLKLNINNIAYLDRKALKGLTNLTTLRLDNNLLTDLFDSTFSDLSQLKTLNLRNNRISVIFNGTFHSLSLLHILDLGGNKITHFQQGAFGGLHSLANLYLDGNYLRQIDSCQFWRLGATLQVLDLKGNFIRYLKRYTQSPFVNLTQLKDLKLNGQLPHGIILLPNAFFRGLQNLTSLSLGNNKISSLQSDIFEDLASLEFLSLDDNYDGVKQLQAGVFKNQRKLKRLNAENMGIRSLSAEVFGNLTELRMLTLPKNALQTVDEDLLKNLSKLHYLDLRLNPISCTCPNRWLKNWTSRNHQVQLVYHYDLMCGDVHGAHFYNFDTKVCYLDLGVYLFASTSTLIILLSTIPLLYVKLYWKLKYSYYVFRSWFSEHWRRLREKEEECQYDAFISYNSADEKWVLEQLLPNLEEGGSSFRLCLHHRDFMPGRGIIDNIVTAVYGSRKTVCVVSQHYLNSEWCSLEIQLASYRLFQEFRDVLLLVFLEPIPERQLSAYHRMRKVMLKKTYLQWPGNDCTDPEKAQELFWNQLRRALRSANDRHQVEDEGEKEGEGECFSNPRPVDDETCYLKP